jgi:hypothetical protein
VGNKVAVLVGVEVGVEVYQVPVGVLVGLGETRLTGPSGPVRFEFWQAKERNTPETSIRTITRYFFNFFPF